MTLPVSGGPEQTAREWQDGDLAWADGEPWRRDDVTWWVDDRGGQSYCERTDSEMTAAGAVLLATAEGPVPVGDVRQEWGVRYRWHSSALYPRRLREEPVQSEEMARDEAQKMRALPEHYSDVQIVRRTVSTSPWVVADGE